MKKTSYIILLASYILLGCSTIMAQKATIDGTVKIEGSNMVYLNKVEGSQVKTSDSATVDSKGQFKMEIAVSSPTMYLMKFKGHDKSLLHLMVEPGDKMSIEIEYVPDYDLMHITKTKGSRNVEVYQLFNDIIFQHSKKFALLNQEYAQPGTKEDRKRELSLLYQQEMIAQNNEIRTMLKKNSDALICAFLVTYFDEEAEKNIELYETIDNSLKERYKGNQFVQYVEEKLRTTLGAGRTAPEIEMKDPNGVTRKLSDLRGKVVMIDFWASWCSPCRTENPNVVRLYKKYHDKGFEIYSVSLDKTRDAWLRAIQQDGLEWPNHVSDLNGWTSSGGATYGIRSVPSTVLVDRDGKIIARNLRGQELANKLKEIFGE